MVDLGIAFVDNWAVGQDKVCYWLSNDSVGLVVIMRSDTNTGIRERTSFVLIGCERSDQYKAKKKD